MTYLSTGARYCSTSSNLASSVMATIPTAPPVPVRSTYSHFPFRMRRRYLPALTISGVSSISVPNHSALKDGVHVLIAPEFLETKRGMRRIFGEDPISRPCRGAHARIQLIESAAKTRTGGRNHI